MSNNQAVLDINTNISENLTMSNSKGNFFTKLFSSLFSSNDPEANKKKKLKAIAKDLSKTKYHFYKNDEVLPNMAKLFYEIYKAIAPSKALFNSIENPNALKYMVVNNALSDEQHQIADSLSKESILAKAQTISVEQISAATKEELKKFLSAFDSDKITSIELTYKKLLIYKSFCTYDFFFMLKKFDSSLKENEFTYIPKFEKINAEYLVEDLKDFMCVVKPVVEYSDWSDMMKMFKTTRGSEPINPAVWNKIVAKLESIVSSLTFDYMLKLMSKDPDYFTDYEIKDEPIVDAYLDKIRQEAESTLAQLAAAQKSSQIDNYLNQIFGTTDVVRLRNYTEQASAPFERKSLGKYLYAGPINYYKAFLLDYIKKDLREFADLVLIRGTWSSQTLSTPMSNAYNALLESTEIINKFDDKMAEDGEIGIKLKTHMPRAERDRDARGIIATLLNDCNEEAKNICLDATRNLVTIAKVLKPLIEDYAKPKGVLIINWKELDKFSDHPIKQLGTDVYKHIYLFVTLMQNCFTQK